MNLTTQLDQLETAQLVRHLAEPEPTYIFKHALTQDTAYESLLKQMRRTIHNHVAETIEQIYPEQLDEYAALLAQHYAEAGKDAKTAEYAIRAGDQATRLFSYVEARLHYAHAMDALTRLPDTEDYQKRRVDTLLKQVSVSLRAQGPAETLKRLTEVEPLAQLFAERADATREDRLRLARVHFWQGHALIHHNDSRASIEKMRQVLKVAQTENDLPLLAVSASVIGRSLVLQGQFVQAMPILTDAIAALEQTHDEHEWIFSVGLRGFAMAMRGDFARGVAEAERTLARANQIGTLTGISLAHFILAMTYLFGDSIALAMEHSRAVMETAAHSGDRMHTYIAHGYLAWAQTRANQLDDAETSFAQAQSIAQTIGGRLAFSDWFTVARAEREFRLGEYTQAIILAQDVIALGQESGGIFYAGLAHRVWGQSLAKQNQPDWAQAESHFAASIELFEAGDAKLETARTHLVWGKLLIERNDRASAKTHLDQAAAQLQSSGMTRELNEARVLVAESESA